MTTQDQRPKTIQEIRDTISALADAQSAGNATIEERFAALTGVAIMLCDALLADRALLAANLKGAFRRVGEGVRLAMAPGKAAEPAAPVDAPAPSPAAAPEAPPPSDLGPSVFAGDPAPAPEPTEEAGAFVIAGLVDVPADVEIPVAPPQAKRRTAGGK